MNRNLILIYTLSIQFLFVTTPAYALVQLFSSTIPKESQFVPDEKLKDRVKFWVDIYSKYTTQQGVFHLVSRPEAILATIDLTSIYENSVLTDFEKNRLAEKKIKEVREKTIAQWKIQDSRSLRLQMGLKDRMQMAFYKSGKYLEMMEQIFTEKKIPVELTRLVFVESSFNIFAQSKVGASGLWQIMPSVAKPEGYLKPHYDKRNHPYYATLLAADILKDNYQGLKSWPLAITAYNHGLTGVKRMVQKAGSNKIEDLIDSKKFTSSWGFASENFYACFLAVLEVERNAESLFGKNLIQSQPLKTQNIKLKTSTTKEKVLSWYGGSITRFKQLNPHLRSTLVNSRSKRLPAGLPLIVPHDIKM